LELKRKGNKIIEQISQLVARMPEDQRDKALEYSLVAVAVPQLRFVGPPPPRRSPTVQGEKNVKKVWYVEMSGKMIMRCLRVVLYV
jgi:hypothetical protein